MITCICPLKDENKYYNYNKEIERALFKILIAPRIYVMFEQVSFIDKCIVLVKT